MTGLDLKPFDLFAELTDEDREALVELLEEKKVAKGVPLYREGSESEGLVLIAKGEVRIEAPRDGRNTVLGPGSTLGGLSLLVVGKRGTTAVAETACVCWTLERTAFRRLADDAPRTALRLAEAVVSEFAGAVREHLDV